MFKFGIQLLTNQFYMYWVSTFSLPSDVPLQHGFSNAPYSVHGHQHWRNTGWSNEDGAIQRHRTKVGIIPSKTRKISIHHFSFLSWIELQRTSDNSALENTGIV
jgi:hypothetical protein